jgi:hypothetical protein
VIILPTEITSATITDALRAAGINHQVENPGTPEAVVIVTNALGQKVKLTPGHDEGGDITGKGIDVDYYCASGTRDVPILAWIPTVDQLVHNMRTFIILGAHMTH